MRAELTVFKVPQLKPKWAKIRKLDDKKCVFLSKLKLSAAAAERIFYGNHANGFTRLNPNIIFF
jgi:hypothetical protein